MCSCENYLTFFIHCWPSLIASCFYYPPEISNFFVHSTMAVSQCNTTRIKVSAPSSCFTPNYPPDCVFICLSVRTSVCWTALLYDPAHFPLTFHFLYSHPVSRTTALCECVCCAVSLSSHWLVLCRGCARSCQLQCVDYPSSAPI